MLVGPAAYAAPACAKHHTVLWWVRRDLRVADNPALAAALQSASRVIPVFVWAPEEEGQFQPGRASRWWLRTSLGCMSDELARLGSRLVCYSSADTLGALTHVLRATGATALFINRLYDPITMVRDTELLARLTSMGIGCYVFNSDLLYEPWEVLDPSAKPYGAFEAFWQRVMHMPHPPLPPIPAPVALPAVPPEAGGLPLDDLGLLSPEEALTNQQLEFTWKPGSAGAHKMFAKFVSKRLRAFAHDRAKTDRASTSRLSPHIHFGEISVRFIYYVARQKESEWHAAGERLTSCSDFLKQMGYREYSRYLSWHFPFTHERSLLEHVRACPYRMDQNLFKAWRQGNTGYPLVDAAMRELWSSGWMHNRVRVTAASFLVKHLLLPWQWGLKHFWDSLVDADLECDALGWQYCAGCLADAHPFDYMMDHSKESKRFDPDGQYVRRWLPVLARLPRQYIHEPWTAPQQVLDEAGVELGVNYPFPVIELYESRRLLDAAKDVVDAALNTIHKTEAAAGQHRGPYRPPTLNPLDPVAPDNLKHMYAKFQLQLSRDAGTAESNLRPAKRRAPSVRFEGEVTTSNAVEANAAAGARASSGAQPMEGIASPSPSAAAAAAGAGAQEGWEGRPQARALRAGRVHVHAAVLPGGVAEEGVASNFMRGDGAAPGVAGEASAHATASAGAQGELVSCGAHAGSGTAAAAQQHAKQQRRWQRQQASASNGTPVSAAAPGATQQQQQQPWLGQLQQGSSQQVGTNPPSGTGGSGSAYPSYEQQAAQQQGAGVCAATVRCSRVDRGGGSALNDMLLAMTGMGAMAGSGAGAAGVDGKHVCNGSSDDGGRGTTAHGVSGFPGSSGYQVPSSIPPGGTSPFGSAGGPSSGGSGGGSGAGAGVSAPTCAGGLLSSPGPNNSSQAMPHARIPSADPGLGPSSMGGSVQGSVGHGGGSYTAAAGPPGRDGLVEAGLRAPIDAAQGACPGSQHVRLAIGGAEGGIRGGAEAQGRANGCPSRDGARDAPLVPGTGSSAEEVVADAGAESNEPEGHGGCGSSGRGGDDWFAAQAGQLATALNDGRGSAAVAAAAAVIASAAGRQEADDSDGDIQPMVVQQAPVQKLLQR